VASAPLRDVIVAPLYWVTLALRGVLPDAEDAVQEVFAGLVPAACSKVERCAGTVLPDRGVRSRPNLSFRLLGNPAP
jgi:hypothetical protein